MSARFVLAQISDLHVTAGGRPEGIDYPAQARRALDLLRAYRPDAIIATGDLVNDARPEEYEALAPLLADPPAPLYLMAGNHDDPALLRATFPDHSYLPHGPRLSYTIDTLPVRIVALDALAPGETHGVFLDEDAAWLERALAAAPKRPTVVAVHHPPFMTHETLFDRIGLHRQDLFAAIIARHRQVELIVCGHHHRVVQGRVAHAPAIVAPSTAFTYGLSLRSDQPIGLKTAEAPGFALHVWPEAGPVASHFILL